MSESNAQQPESLPPQHGPHALQIALPQDVVITGNTSSSEYLMFAWPKNATMRSLHARVMDIGPIREYKSRFNGQMDQVINVILANESLDMLQLTAFNVYVQRLLENLHLGCVCFL